MDKLIKELIDAKKDSDRANKRLKAAKEAVDVEIGVHSHDDMGMAVANSIMAVEAGAKQVQGTFIGIGERCGNANLSAIIPILKFKMNMDILDGIDLIDLTKTSRFIAEVCNMTLDDESPFVGNSSFAHKGGMHIDAVTKCSKSYEHIDPKLVGNKRRFLVSHLLLSIVTFYSAFIRTHTEETSQNPS